MGRDSSIPQMRKLRHRERERGVQLTSGRSETQTRSELTPGLQAVVPLPSLSSLPHPGVFPVPQSPPRQGRPQVSSSPLPVKATVPLKALSSAAGAHPHGEARPPHLLDGGWGGRGGLVRGNSLERFAVKLFCKFCVVESEALE